MSEKEQSLKAISKRLDRIEETLDKVVEFLKEDEIELDLGLDDIILPVDEEWYEEEESPKKEHKGETEPEIPLPVDDSYWSDEAPKPEAPKKKSHEEKVRAELEAQSSEVKVIEKTVPEEEAEEEE